MKQLFVLWHYFFSHPMTITLYTTCDRKVLVIGKREFHELTLSELLSLRWDRTPWKEGMFFLESRCSYAWHQLGEAPGLMKSMRRKTEFVAWTGTPQKSKGKHGETIEKEFPGNRNPSADWEQDLDLKWRRSKKNISNL